MAPSDAPAHAHPAAVLFDAGGTLLQLDVGRLQPRLRAAGLQPRRPLLDGFWYAVSLLDSEFAPGHAPFEAWFPRWIDRIAEHVGLPSEPFRETYLAVDREAMLWSAPIAGAEATLRALADAGLRVGVVSNADGRIAQALARAGLATWLEVIVDSAVVGVEKPDPAIFDHALDQLGVSPEVTWYVGDSVAYDVPAAESGGLTPWLVDHTGWRPVRHGRTITGFESLLQAALR